MKAWSKLQSELYDLITPDVKFKLHCVRYPMRSQWGGTDIPRYWITIDQEIVWDYPKDFKQPKSAPNGVYPYVTDISDISALIREYIDSPKDGLLQKVFENDRWGLAPILKVSDRRIGKRQLRELKEQSWNMGAVAEIISIRLGKPLEKHADGINNRQSKGYHDFPCKK